MKDTKKERTLYEVLGVPRTAKLNDIGLAYNRFKSRQQREDAAPDARLAAQMKVAYETLSDLDKRAEYDRSLVERAVKRPTRRIATVAIGAAVLVAVAAVASMYAARTREIEAAAPPTPEQLLALGEQLMMPIEETRISGEVSRAGVALVTGKYELVTPCHTLSAGAQIMVGTGAKATRAEMSRADAERDICLLRVNESVGPVAKWGMLEAAPGQKVYAVVRDGPRPTQLKEGRITRAIPGAKGGRAFEVSLAGEVPNGTPLLDHYGRVVGIVTTPHDFGPGLTVALGSNRIMDTLGIEHKVEAAAEAALAAQPKTSHGVDENALPAEASTEPTRTPRTRKEIEEQRNRTLDQELVRQVNGVPPKK